MQDHEQFPIIPIEKAKGVWLFDFSGKRYLDAISSWWVNIFGHNHPLLNAALTTQADSMAHIMLAGFTHRPIIELSEQLLERAPPGLNRCFYADNGSAAIEVALKMSMHSWLNRGNPQKNQFVALENSYHGETLGALSVTDIPLFSHTYAPLLRAPLRVASPDCSALPASAWEHHSLQQFQYMQQLLSEQHEHIAAVIVEPLVQGAAGMRMYHPVYLQQLRQACDHYQVHLIADEIATGFGRTGTFFACEQAAIRPDFLCLSKALTAGYLPMSVVLTTETIYQTFYGPYATMKGFMHSHSYTGNALAAAVALASLKIFTDEAIVHNNRNLSLELGRGAQRLPSQYLKHLRQTGMILAFDLCDASGQDFHPSERRGLQLHQAALRRGLLIRPIGNRVYLMPPYIIQSQEIAFMFDVLAEALEETAREPARLPDHPTVYPSALP